MKECENRESAMAVAAPSVHAARAAQNVATGRAGAEQDTARRKQWLAWLYLALAMSIAGSAVVAGKLLVGSLPVFLAAELGLGAGLLVMLPMLWLRKEGGALDRRTHATLALQALCGIALYRVFTFEGLRFTSAASAGLMSSAAPAVIGLLAWGCYASGHHCGALGALPA